MKKKTWCNYKRKILNELFLDECNQQKEYKPEFYIPDFSCFECMKSNQRLTIWQISQMIKYINKNYYLENEHRDLTQFCIEWTILDGDPDRVCSRKQIAIQKLIKDLSSGNKISVLDALWASERIYVEGDESIPKRIITKKVVDGVAVLDVKSQKHCDYVEDEMRQLAHQLNVSKIPKVDANIW